MKLGINKKKGVYYLFLIAASILLILCIEVFYNVRGNILSKGDDYTYKSGFDWTTIKGEKIKIILNQHPYSEAIIKRLAEFEDMTGIKVEYVIIPEENYANKVTALLNNQSGEPDVFMTGSYYIWEYASKNLILDLNPLIKKKLFISPSYDISDFNSAALNSLKWDLVPGHKVGTGSQWALPMGFEINALAYNKKVFKEKGLNPPKTMDELIDLCKKLNGFNGENTYALALRGDRKWSNIVTSYITTYANYGAKDFEIQNGKLESKVNSKEAVKITDIWAELIKEGVSPNWTSCKWYQAGADLGAGKAAMLFDADNNAYFQNIEGYSKEAGNIAWAAVPLENEDDKVRSNLWAWGLAINNFSRNQLASWIFLQYFTSKEFLLSASLNDGLMNPARESVLNNPLFLKKIDSCEGYLETLNTTMDNAEVLFTPQPYFFEVSSKWSEVLLDIVTGKYETTQKGMDDLKKQIDRLVGDINLR